MTASICNYKFHRRRKKEVRQRRERKRKRQRKKEGALGNTQGKFWKKELHSRIWPCDDELCGAGFGWDIITTCDFGSCKVLPSQVSSPAVRLFQHFTENWHPSRDDRFIMKKERGRETKKIKDETWMDLHAVYLVIVKAWFSSITFRKSCRKKEKHEETVNKSDRHSQQWSHTLKKKVLFTGVSTWH